VVIGSLWMLTAAAGCASDDVDDVSVGTAPQLASAPPVAASAQVIGALVPQEPEVSGPPRAYGDFCVKNADCASELCYEAACTVSCDMRVINSCRDVDAFCASTHDTRFACQGSVVTGSDTDGDVRMFLAQPVVTKLAPAGDADLMEVALPAGRYEITAQPAPDGDVAIEVYGELTKLDAAADGAGMGAAERATLNVPSAGRYFVVVRDAVGAPANVTVVVKPAL
jgi:hypothetical protein